MKHCDFLKMRISELEIELKRKLPPREEYILKAKLFGLKIELEFTNKG